MFTTLKQHSKKAGMTLAALALTAAACPAQAQVFNNNAFFPAGPRIFTPLGGGVLANLGVNSGFNSGFNTGFGSFNNGFNSRFEFPLNANFNGQLAALNAQRGAVAPTISDFNARLAALNAQRTTTTYQFATQNTALNAPLSNFSNAGPVFAGNVNSGFVQVNPSINPFLVNGSVNGNLGFNSFNGFNALSGAVTGFGGSGVPVAAQIQNVSPRRAADRRFAMPNAPASAYPTAAQIAAANQAFIANQANGTAYLNTGMPPAGAGYRIPLANTGTPYLNTGMPAPGAGYRIPLANTGAPYLNTGMPAPGSGYRIPLATTNGVYLNTGMPAAGAGYRIPLGGSAFGSGVSIMGARAAR